MLISDISKPSGVPNRDSLVLLGTYQTGGYGLRFKKCTYHESRPLFFYGNIVPAIYGYIPLIYCSFNIVRRVVDKRSSHLLRDSSSTKNARFSRQKKWISLSWLLLS